MNILIGVSASIAAHRALDLASSLRKLGHEVAAVFSENAQRLLTPASMEAITGRRVVTTLWDGEHTGNMDHLALTKWADVFVVVPASANCLATLALGTAQDALGTMALAWPVHRPMIVCPAMNPTMWAHPTVQVHKAQLMARGVLVVGPVSGDTACRDQGEGRLAPVEEILQAVIGFASNSQPPLLRGRNVLITGGPTAEPLDPVRHITNLSTGRMAVALAEQARAFGAHVHLVIGPTSLPMPEGPAIDVYRVTTAKEMLHQVLEIQPNAALLIFAAAVSDWTPREPSAEKLRKEALPPDAVLRVELVRTPDIALAANQARLPGQVLVGFSAESRDPIPTALAKAARKGFDLVFANPIDQTDAGFGSATNHGWLIQPIPSAPNASDPTVEAVTVRSKSEVARLILQRAAALLPRANQGA